MARAPTPAKGREATPQVAEPERPKNLPHGSWHGDFPDLSDAEKRLLECARTGTPWAPKNWNRKRPERGTVDNRLRAGLVRFLLLGGDGEHPVHRRGLKIRGAWIADTLYLDELPSEFALRMTECHFTQPIQLMNGRLSEINLSLSSFPGLNAEGVQVKGAVILDEAKALGEVSLLGASIGGQLACVATRFCNAGGDAFIAQGVDVKGVALLEPSEIVGTFVLIDANLTSMVDSPNAWPRGNYLLNGLIYQRLHGEIDVRERIAWLRGQQADFVNEHFAPQPWEQLIKVLREMGHTAEAAEVAIAKQDQLRIAKRIGLRQVKEFPGSLFPRFRNRIDRMWNPVSNALTRGAHWLYGVFSGYGYRPQRIVYIMALVTMVCSLGYYEGRHDGLMGPSDALIYKIDRPAACGTGGDPGKVYWTDAHNCPVPAEFTTFQPFLYSLDLILPLVDLHQENEWAPLVVDTQGDVLWGGRFLRWMMWFEILFGWAASLMLVAILGRLVDKD